MTVKSKHTFGYRVSAIVAATLLLAVTVALTACGLFSRKTEILPNNVYDKTLIIAADTDFEPYSFTGENGEPAGRDIELIYALADIMQVNIEIRLMTWSDANAAVINGDADVLLGAVYDPLNMPEFILSTPLNDDPFVAFGKESFRDLSELFGKKLAVINNSSVFALFIKPYMLESNTTEYDTYTEAFASVERGENDYVISSYSVGRRALAKLSETDIRAVGPALAGSDFCFAVSSSDTELAAALNSAILKARIDGTVDLLADKWLGSYVNILTVSDLMAQYPLLLILFILLIFLILLSVITVSVFGMYRQRLRSAKQNEMKLIEEISHDPMTGLLNKSATESRIVRILQASKASEKYAFFMIDIDSFKEINDTLGHKRGDEVINDFAMKVDSVFRDSDVIGRVGGDEFSVLMQNYGTRENLIRKAETLNNALRFETELDGKKMSVTGSVGIAVYPENGLDYDTLRRNADSALYKSKHAGKDRYTFCSPADRS